MQFLDCLRWNCRLKRITKAHCRLPNTTIFHWDSDISFFVVVAVNNIAMQ
jgi:hypothetical protein